MFTYSKCFNKFCTIFEVSSRYPAFQTFLFSVYVHMHFAINFLEGVFAPYTQINHFYSDTLFILYDWPLYGICFWPPVWMLRLPRDFDQSVQELFETVFVNTYSFILCLKRICPYFPRKKCTNVLCPKDYCVADTIKINTFIDKGTVSRDV